MDGPFSSNTSALSWLRYGGRYICVNFWKSGVKSWRVTYYAFDVEMSALFYSGKHFLSHHIGIGLTLKERFKMGWMEIWKLVIVAA